MKAQKRLAAGMLKCSPKRIVFDKERLEEIKEAITRADIRSLIKSKAIKKVPARGVSRVRARKSASQKRKGLKKGPGSKKGGRRARIKKKDEWKNKVRLQRSFLKELKEKGKITRREYRTLYRRVKGGFFRSKRHLKLLVMEQK